jgi:serine/threonine protein kinase
MPSRLGALAGRYLLTRLLGEEEAIATYEGLDSDQDWPVLIKLLPKALARDPDRRQQLERLVDRLTALDHPNLQTIVDAGIEEGVPYLIAEGIAATPLAAKMDHPLDVQRVAGIVTQIGDALAHAHEQGISHGNLSPKKVLLTAADRVQIADLGLESVLETPWEQVREAPTPYLAPERIRGQRPDARTDVYALTAMLYELLTGLKPDGPVEGIIQWLRETAPEVAPNLAPILSRALAPNPQDRYTNAAALMADLRPALAPFLEKPDQPPSTQRPDHLTPPETPEPAPEPEPDMLSPALDGIPAIPMPEPPPMPTFDWDIFSAEVISVHLPEPLPPPEPPPLPRITAEGIEFPSISPPAFEYQPAPSGRPKRKRVKKTAPETPDFVYSATRRPQPTHPQAPPTALESTVSALKKGRYRRQIALFVMGLVVAILLCCCGLLLALGEYSTGASPSTDRPGVGLIREPSPEPWPPFGGVSHGG